MTSDARVIDLSGWQPDKSYGLIEIVQHGGDDYARPTQKGINVLTTMMRLAGHASFPENILKVS
jgi:hypothetical protein